MNLIINHLHALSRKWIFGLLALAVLWPSHAGVAQSLHPNDLVAICGDSITEAQLYSVFIEDYLMMCQPAPGLQAMQFGWSAQASWGFLPRLENDVLPFEPTVATTLFGMNDGGYVPVVQRKLDLFRTTMEDIVKSLKRGGVRLVVVGSPSAVDTDTFKRLLPLDPAGDTAKNIPKWLSPGEYNETLGALSVISKEVAENNGGAFADIHEIMLRVMAKAKEVYGNSYHVAGPDGVHPAANGHLVIAYAFLKAMGCSGKIGTVFFDWKTNQANTTDGHKILSASKGRIEVESSRYPFCFYGDPIDPNSTSGIIKFFPFNQDLNRFLLIIKNAPSKRLRVTWGDATKEFSAIELEQGVNLAEEFLENPFKKEFFRVESVIKKQQAFEKPAVKVMMNSLLTWRQKFPEAEAEYRTLAQKIVGKSESLRRASRAAVVPIRHVILVETM